MNELGMLPCSCFARVDWRGQVCRDARIPESAVHGGGKFVSS
jgi:hypothetical protein